MPLVDSPLDPTSVLESPQGAAVLADAVRHARGNPQNRPPDLQLMDAVDVPDVGTEGAVQLDVRVGQARHDLSGPLAFAPADGAVAGAVIGTAPSGSVVPTVPTVPTEPTVTVDPR